MKNTYEELKNKALQICREKNLLEERVTVRARTLTTEEAIGNPEGDDFPLQKGKERLMQADFRGALGQAFTDQFGDFEGSLDEIFNMPLANNFRRAIFTATLNALLRYLGLAQGTIHCRDEGPTHCAAKMVAYIQERFGPVKITQVGFQPRIVQAMAESFDVRLLDMDPENIGQEKFGVMVESPEATEDALQWADLLLVTGTTLTNDTIEQFLFGKPVIFYGTTIAGAAYLMGWERFCAESK